MQSCSTCVRLLEGLSRICLIAAVLSALVTPLRARSLQPEGLEFQASTYTTSAQGDPSISSDADGDFVVVWHSFAQNEDNFGYGIFAQRYQSSGAALGQEFHVNTFTDKQQAYPSVSSDADGDFVVVWHSWPQDDSSYGVVAQRYQSSGARLGEELRVNTFVTGFQGYASVSSAADGDFVVVWQSVDQDGSANGVFAQRYQSSGAALGEELSVNTYTTGTQRYPSVSSEANGDFVVIWQSLDQDGSNYGIFAQRFQSSGAALGEELQVNTYTTDTQRSASVSSDADGDFIVVWQSRLQDGSRDGVYAQRYQSSGAALGAELLVTSYGTGSQRSPSVSSDAAGNFVVAWYSYLPNGSYEIYARRYLSSGAALGAELLVNSYTTGGQRFPVVAYSDGGVAVVWESRDQDGSDYGIFGQRFTLGVELSAGSASPSGLLPGVGSALLVGLLLLGRPVRKRRSR